MSSYPDKAHAPYDKAHVVIDPDGILHDEQVYAEEREYNRNHPKRSPSDFTGLAVFVGCAQPTAQRVARR